MTGRFYDLPRRRSGSAHTRAREEFLLSVNKRKDVEAVYSFGSGPSEMSAEFSDVDLVIVSEGLTEGRREDLYARGRGLIDLKAIDREGFKELQKVFLYSGMELRHEAGQCIATDVLTGPERRVALSATLLVFTLKKLALLAEHESLQIIPVRWALRLLHGIGHDIRGARLLGAGTSTAEGFLHGEEALRAVWFDMDQEAALARLQSLLGLGKIILLEQARFLARVMAHEGPMAAMPALPDPLVFRVHPNTLFVFSDEMWAANQEDPFVRVRNLAWFLNIFPRLREICGLAEWKAVVLPKTLAAYFLFQGCGETLLAAMVRASCVGPWPRELSSAGVPFEKEFGRQRFLMERHRDFLAKNKARSGLAPFLEFFTADVPGTGLKGYIRQVLSRANYERAVDAVSIL